MTHGMPCRPWDSSCSKWATWCRGGSSACHTSHPSCRNAVGASPVPGLTEAPLGSSPCRDTSTPVQGVAGARRSLRRTASTPASSTSSTPTPSSSVFCWETKTENPSYSKFQIMDTRKISVLKERKKTKDTFSFGRNHLCMFSTIVVACFQMNVTPLFWSLQT